MVPVSSSIMKNTILPLEVAVFSPASALQAQNLGAQRVEINAPGSYPLGGITPPVSDVVSIAHLMSIPVRVMIRPRGAMPSGEDFVYTDGEFDAMRRSILEFKAADVLSPVRGDGFVFGILKPQDPAKLAKYPDDRYDIDEKRCAELVQLAQPLACVFHRAFDPVAAGQRGLKGLETLQRCGFEAVLTAGGQGDAETNSDKLENMCRRTGSKIQFIIGGGLRKHNIGPLAAKLATHPECSIWLHTAALGPSPNRQILPSESVDADVLLGIIDELGLTSPD